MKNEDDIKFTDTLYKQSNASINKQVIILFISIILFFSCAIIWSSLAQIDELVRGEGKVIPSAKIQTIQSLDGGVISDILIREGSIVKIGQPLLKIDTTRFKASFDENKNTLEDLLASRIRLTEEVDINVEKKINELNFSKYNLKNYTDIINGQKSLYKVNFQELKSNVFTLKIQIKQKEQELLELYSKKNQLKESMKLTEEEMITIEKLVKRKVRSNMDLISIKKEFNNIRGDYNSARLSIPRSKLSIQESKNNIVEKVRMFKSKAALELQKVNMEINKYESKVISEEDKLDKTSIVSPVNGIIKQIYINTVGGVVRSGADLIEIVPESKILLIEAKIDPKDIAFINPKQKAIVKITGYDFSIYGGLDGRIVEISADSIKDKDSKDGKTYYKVVVQTEKNHLLKDGIEYPIIPGMVTGVDIITGKKTILDFILKPILKTKESALHER